MSPEQMRMILQQKFMPQPMGEAVSDRLDVQPRESMAIPTTPTLLNSLGSGISQGLEYAGISPSSARQVGSSVADIADIATPFGTGTAIDDTIRAAGQGDVFGVGMGLLSAVPFAGKPASKGIKKAKGLLDEIDGYHVQNNLTNEIKASASGNLGAGFYIYPKGLDDVQAKTEARGLVNKFKYGENPYSVPVKLEKDLNLFETNKKVLKDRYINQIKQSGYDGVKRVENGVTQEINVFDESKVRNAFDDFNNSDSQPIESLFDDFGGPYKAKVYHQTDKDFDDFDFDKTSDGTVWFTDNPSNFSDPSSSSSAAAGKGRIIERDVELNKVAGYDELDKYSVGELIDQGYDGAVLDGDIQVFNPSAIKSNKAESLFDSIDTSYRMQHTAPYRDEDNYNSSLDDVTDMFGDDIYTGNAVRYFGVGSDYDQEAVNIIQKMAGDPDGMVTIYRAVPEGVDDINPRDWVTTTKQYALDHIGGDEGYKVISKEVKAKDVFTDGNSIHEFGYDPTDK
jgi:hypothetical protein